MPPAARAWIGISGYDYKPWRGRFYPDDLPARRWLEYASRRFNSVELNGTFYSLKSPAVFQRWVAEVPARDFVFAVKGGRFITHNLKLRNVDTALGNFFASGVLALGAQLGPVLWQLPERVRFDRERVRDFLELLPTSTGEASRLAEKHDDKLKEDRILTTCEVDVRMRHALEPRHDSFDTEEARALCAEYGVAMVIADSAGTWPVMDDATSDFRYVRLHGETELYASGYTDESLDRWARTCRYWMEQGHDVHVYFDNDAKGHAPYDAVRLLERLGVRTAAAQQ